MATIWDELDKVHPPARQKPVWMPICLCGHTRNHHPVEQGGTYALMPTQGCFGPMAGRGVETMQVIDGAGVRLATCPCRQWRPVAEYDRPRQALFRAKLSATKPPFLVGLQAFRTSQRNRKGMTEETAQAEVERRFRWIEGARVCATCGATGEDVWPAYVNGDRHSEMRCGEHR